MSLFSINLQKYQKQSGRLFIVLFVLSSLFPIFASIINKDGRIFKFAGYFDVLIAVLCFLLYVKITLAKEQYDAIPVITKARKLTEYAASLPLILILLYFFNIEVNWTILLIGLGWRFWLLILIIPHLVAIFYKSPASSSYTN